MLLHAMVHIAAGFAWTCLGFDSPIRYGIDFLLPHVLNPKSAIFRASIERECTSHADRVA